jgi:hypothetical protein
MYIIMNTIFKSIGCLLSLLIIQRLGKDKKSSSHIHIAFLPSAIQLIINYSRGEDFPTPMIIHLLVTRFEENHEACRSGKYNEAQLRQE